MKSLEKVINDRKSKIELNNLTITNYGKDLIECECNECSYEVKNNYRNLSYKKFKCKYCVLMKKSKLINEGFVKIIKIEKQNIYLECENGHKYKQNRRNLLANKKCNICYLNNKTLSKKETLIKFKKIHGDFFKYDMNNYETQHSKIKITCDKNHTFLQKVSNHLQGKGCPICRESLGEKKIRLFLEEKNIKYIRQKKYKDCVYINKLPFDFHLPDFDILIEYDGIQHFEPVKLFGGKKEFIKTKKKDKIKNEYCYNNNIHLIRIPYHEKNIKKFIDQQIGHLPKLNS